MSDSEVDPRVIEDLRATIERGLASGALMTAEKVAEHLGRFRERFGPAVLRNTDGEALLRLMHGRKEGAPRCLAYWLEFKNDDEFAGHRFGGIGGGSAHKFGVFQRQPDDVWVTGTAQNQKVVALAEAIEIARRQRDELLAADDVLARLDPGDVSDAAYARLQVDIDRVASSLSGSGWAHKYWHLIHSERLDDCHTPKFQRFYLLKLLQRPPDGTGILDAQAPRFVCAGRFVAIAQQLGAPMTITTEALMQQLGAIHRYWRIGTTEGDGGESQWSLMRDGGYVSIGWPSHVPNLSRLAGEDPAAAKAAIQEMLAPAYPDHPAVAKRKAGEIRKFLQEIAENDLVLACEGKTVRGIGRVTGSYEHDGDLSFPHKRPVEWLSLEEWTLPESEGPRTAVYELGRSADNVLAIERHARAGRRGPTPSTAPVPPPPQLDSLTSRIDSILARKGQVILYGPPGTGKTYRALAAARELAARKTFGRSFSALSPDERERVDGAAGVVRVCTFHAGYGYEDFIEGLRPRTVDGAMLFEPRDGLFKRLCADAEKEPRLGFYLVIDEINRGDVPRILGELITIIEQDKRDLQITLPVSGTSFRVPRNVFLIGTMNTADRSISLLDAALRRRFGFIELMPDSAPLTGRSAGDLPLGPWLDALNARVRRCLKRDARNLQIGHAYLMPRAPITSIAEFSRVLRDDIIPLLEEYCYDDFATLREILGGELVDLEAGRIREDLFAPGREAALIQALTFEEMETTALAQEPAGAPPDADADDDDEPDGAPDATPATTR